MNITRSFRKKSDINNLVISRDHYNFRNYNNLEKLEGVFKIHKEDEELRISMDYVKKIEIELSEYDFLINVAVLADGTKLIVEL